MKIEKRYRKHEPGAFSGIVEVAVTGIDDKYHRMSKNWRRSFRVGDTTIEEVFDVVYKALEEQSADGKQKG